MSNSSTTNDNRYLKTESLGGALLLIGAVLGFVLNNSKLAKFYDALINFNIKLHFLDFDFTKPFIFWVNEGLISIFFFLIGLEIKYMFKYENTKATDHFLAPLAGAIFGVIVPALIFTLFNHDDAIAMRGWAIPTAMDTAFIVGIISLLGSPRLHQLKIFVMTMSIIDDIIAVLVIAFFYSKDLSNTAIVLSTALFGLLLLFNQLKINKGIYYLIIGLLLWAAVLASGVHTSIAGVLIACAIPTDQHAPNSCLLIKCKTVLHPWVSFFILPLFAFVNSGVDVYKVSWGMFLEPLSLGIVLGLFVGKQLGIFGITYFLKIKKIIRLPEGCTMTHLYGVCVLCGVGFTLSLFIGILAFKSQSSMYNELVKASVFVGSLASAIVGYVILFFALRYSEKK